MTSEDFHAYLRTQFTTLREAVDWARRWYADGQALPEWGSFTMRAMAAHISMALEGREYEDTPLGTNYLQTRYGTLLYYAMGEPVGTPVTSTPVTRPEDR
jgi:hypothetical protein